MCMAPAAATRRCRMATTWIIALPAIFTTRTAITATTTVRWCLPKAEPRFRGDALRSPRRLGRGRVKEVNDRVGNSLRLPCANQAIRHLVSWVVDWLHKLERFVIARSPQGDAAISSRLLRCARNDSIEIHGELLTQDTSSAPATGVRPHALPITGQHGR